MSIKCFKRGFLLQSYFIGNGKLHTSCINGFAHVGKTMRKVLGSNSKKRSCFYNEKVSNTNIFSTKIVKETPANPRRATVLNKLFMRNITDLMSTGDYASQILGLGIEINKVKITSDFKILKIYWVSKGSQETPEDILQKSAGLLRHELSALRLMGNVPVIQFVKDKQYSDLIELENRLARADYGEEGPSNVDPAAQFISEFELSIPVEKNLKDEIEKLDKENPEEEPFQLPPMSHYVFDLDHSDILNRVKRSDKKIRLNQGDEETWASFKLKQYSNTEAPTLASPESQREAFNKFLLQRQILKTKQRQTKNYELNNVFIEEEQELMRNSKYIQNNDDDFILEDDDQKL